MTNIPGSKSGTELSWIAPAISWPRTMGSSTSKSPLKIERSVPQIPTDLTSILTSPGNIGGIGTLANRKPSGVSTSDCMIGNMFIPTIE